VARITIEDCLEKVPSRFQLVHMAAKRVRQIREGSEYLVNAPKNEDIVVALREIAAAKVMVKTLEEDLDVVDETGEAEDASASEEDTTEASVEAAESEAPTDAPQIEEAES